MRKRESKSHNRKFNIKKAFNFGWRAVENNFWLFIFLSMSIFFIGVLSGMISEWLSEHPNRYAYLVHTGLYVLEIVSGLFLTRVLLNFIDNNNIFSGFRKAFYLFPQFLFGNLLYFLIILGGFMLLIIPGIVWAIKYQFFSYLIVDKNMTALQALKKSGEITQGFKKDLFILGLVFFVINIVGFFAFFVGLFVSMPITWLMMVYVYRKLLGD